MSPMNCHNSQSLISQIVRSINAQAFMLCFNAWLAKIELSGPQSEWENFKKCHII